jgi:hypothetical protein
LKAVSIFLQKTNIPMAAPNISSAVTPDNDPARHRAGLFLHDRAVAGDDQDADQQKRREQAVENRRPVEALMRLMSKKSSAMPIAPFIFQRIERRCWLGRLFAREQSESRVGLHRRGSDAEMNHQASHIELAWRKTAPATQAIEEICPIEKDAASQARADPSSSSEMRTSQTKTA